jgi:hypothetical protein
MLEMEREEDSQRRRVRQGKYPHRAIGELRGRSLGVLHVGFDELEGESRQNSARGGGGGGGGGRGWASGVGSGGEFLLGGSGAAAKQQARE